MSIFKNPFARKPIADGVHIVGRRSSQGGLVLQRVAGATVETRAVHQSEEVRCEALFDGSRSKLTYWVGAGAQPFATIPFSSESDCRRVHESFIKSLSWRPSVFKPVLIGLAAAVALIAIDAPSGSSGAATMADTGQVAPQIDPLPVAAGVSSQLSEGEQASVRAAIETGLKMTSSGTRFAVFSDPNCPFCKELEGSLAQLDSNLSPVILPLGYKPGARDVSAAVMCSKDPVKAWKDYMSSGTEPSAKPCDAGYRQVDANMALFQELKLGSTPTMITPSGVVVTGAGTADAIEAVMLK